MSGAVCSSTIGGATKKRNQLFVGPGNDLYKSHKENSISQYHTSDVWQPLPPSVYQHYHMSLTFVLSREIFSLITHRQGIYQHSHARKGVTNVRSGSSGILFLVRSIRVLFCVTSWSSRLSLELLTDLKHSTLHLNRELWCVEKFTQFLSIGYPEKETFLPIWLFHCGSGLSCGLALLLGTNETFLVEGNKVRRRVGVE